VTGGKGWLETRLGNFGIFDCANRAAIFAGAESAGRAGDGSTPVCLNSLTRVELLSLSEPQDISWPAARCQRRQDTAQLTRSECLPICTGCQDGLHIWISVHAGRRPPALFKRDLYGASPDGPLGGLATNQQSSAGPTGGAGGYSERGDGAPCIGLFWSLVTRCRPLFELLLRKRRSADQIGGRH